MKKRGKYQAKWFKQKKLKVRARVVELLDQYEGDTITDRAVATLLELPDTLLGVVRQSIRAHARTIRERRNWSDGAQKYELYDRTTALAITRIAERMSK